MDTLPDLNATEHSNSLTPSEQALLEKLKKDFHDQITQTLSNIKQKSQGVTSNALHSFPQEFNTDLDSIEGLPNKLVAPLNPQRSKKELASLQEIVNTTEKLAFLIRYFNWDNDENYTKLLSSRVSKIHSIIYTFNIHLQNWIKSVIEHVEVNPKVLLRFLSHIKETASSHVPNNLLSIKTPVRIKNTHSPQSSVILLDHYYLERVYRVLDDLMITYASEQVRIKLRTALRGLTHGIAVESESKENESKSGKDADKNALLAELEQERKRIETLKDDNEALEYLFQAKKRLDDIVAQAELYIETMKNNMQAKILTVMSRASSEDINEKETENNKLALSRVDELLSTEIKNFNVGNNVTLKSYWQQLNNEIREEVVKMVSLDKFLLQAAYLHIYFEQRFLVFQPSNGQFIHENFAKLIEEFCITASKEYKSVPPVANTQSFHNLYYCYVAENNQDFYLVEYNPDSPILKVYMTAAPMLATLHKHLAKLDIKKNL